MTVCIPNCEVQGSTVWLHGELDVATVGELAQALAAAVHGSATDVVVDLSATRFVDSATISEIMTARAEAAAGGRRLRLRGVSPRVQRVLQLFAPEPPFEVLD